MASLIKSDSVRRLARTQGIRGVQKGLGSSSDSERTPLLSSGPMKTVSNGSAVVADYLHVASIQNGHVPLLRENIIIVSSPCPSGRGHGGSKTS